MAIVVSLLSIVLLLLHLPSSGNCSATALQYAVQVEPVIFIKEPESQILTDNEQLSLSCQARVAVLVSKRPLPTISWRKNGIPLDGENISINNTRLIGLSVLVIQETSTDSSGYYQCVANDEHGKYVTISRKASVTVLSAEFLIPIKAQLGQPLYLNCSPVFGDVNKWTHNGVAVSNENVVASGSLFISNVDTDHQGIWQCYSAYNITLSSQLFSDEESIPISFVDTKSTDVSYGMTIELYCVIAGLHPRATIENITWYRKTKVNQRLLLTTQEFTGSGYASEDTYIISLLDDSNSGRYFCSIEIISNNRIITIDSQVLDLLTTGIPIVLSSPTVRDVFLEVDANSLKLECSFETKVSFNVIWMKNGKTIDTLNTYNEVTGTLEVSKENFEDEDLFGTYQCFIETDYGANYTLTRVLVKGHSNPPGDLIIRSRTNISNFFLPYLEISWTPPTQRGDIDKLSYLIQIGDTYNVMNYMTKLTSPSSTANSTTVQLSSDSEYTVVVSVYRPNIQGLPANCLVNTRERFFSFNKPFDYLVCTNDGRVLVHWTPLGSDPLLYPTEFVTIEGTCVHDGQIFQFQHLTDELLTPYSEEAFSDLSPGTICQFHGKYHYDHNGPSSSCSNGDYVQLPYYEIPKTTCQVQDNVPVNENIIQLVLLCDISGILIRWNASQDAICESTSSNGSAVLDIFCVCAYEDEVVQSNHSIDLMREPIGQVNFGTVKVNSICSFGKEISDITFVISPAQCVIDSSSQISFDDYSNLGQYHNSINCSKHQYADSMRISNHSSVAYSYETTLLIQPPDKNRQGDAIVAVITFSVCFAVFVIFFVFLLLVIVLRFKRKYNRSLKRSWSLNAFGKEENILADMYEEKCSLKTETNSLRNEDISVGLNIYHGYTIEHAPNKPDTTGSSGYGSEITAQCSDYHSKKLNEVLDEEITNNTNSSSIGSMEDVTNNTNSSSIGSMEDVLSDHQSKEFISICACCSRIHYRRPGSFDNMCSCISNEEYIKLAGLNHSDELVDQCSQLNSKEWQGTTLSV